MSELIHCVYFLDLPGPPRVGFVGTESDLYKTTNGGVSWYKTFKYGEFTSIYISDICFKDSLTGWFLFHSPGPDWCYRTLDGGQTWHQLTAPPATDNIEYVAKTNALFIGHDSVLWVSSDLGDTWVPSVRCLNAKLAFFDSVHGATIVGFTGTSGHPYEARAGGLILTSTGGTTWDSLVYSLNTKDIGGDEILPIRGTPTGFATRSGWWDRKILRTDDYGYSWKVIAQNVYDSTEYGTGMIKGDLTQLFIQTDSGMYRSTDQGITWQFDGGPEDIGPNWSLDRFYSHKGVTIAGRIYANGGFVGAGGLWQRFDDNSVVNSQPRKDNDLCIYPNPTVASTNISFTPEASGYAEITIVNMMGQEISKVYSGVLDASEHRFTWEAQAKACATGVYQCVVRMNGRSQTLPIVVH